MPSSGQLASAIKPQVSETWVGTVV